MNGASGHMIDSENRDAGIYSSFKFPEYTANAGGSSGRLIGYACGSPSRRLVLHRGSILAM